MRKKIIVILLILISILLVLCGLIFQSKYNAYKYNSQSTEEFVIEKGQSTKDIISDLSSKHLIDSKIYTKYILKKENIVFYAGSFELSQSMSDSEVLKVLSNSKNAIDTSTKFLITEGATIDEIAENLSLFTASEDTKDEILSYWSNPDVLNQLITKYNFISDDVLNDDILYPLEGYFFPATYSLNTDSTLEEITTKFLDTMQLKLASIWDESSYANANEILTMASIVERETLLESDKKIAAGVFYNRIDNNMTLQSDITVLYAMQKHKEQVLYEDLKYDSPYNTYLNKGLPPGPISTVSIEAIEAATNPDDNNYLYFFADQKTGELYFSKTLEEHEAISEEHAWEFSK